MLKKCEAKGIRGDILSWIAAWLNDRRQCVKLGDKRSSWKTVLSGVPQGSVLGPLLFIIFIDDIDECVDGLNCVISKFADDTKCLKDVSTEKGVSELQTIIDNLSYWCTRWAMRFNIEKCNILHYGLKNPNHKYRMNGVPLAAVEQEKDIGVILSNNMKPSIHCAEIAKKANRILGMLARGVTYRKKSVFLNLYVLYVRPLLEGAQVVWAPWLMGDRALLEDVQKRCFRLITDWESNTYEERLKESGMTTICDRRRRADLIQMHKTMHGHDGSDLNHFFELAVRENSLIATRELRGYLNVRHNRARRDSRLNFWSVRVTSPWNSLPCWMKRIYSTEEFVRELDRYIMSEDWQNIP